MSIYIHNQAFVLLYFLVELNNRFIDAASVMLQNASRLNVCLFVLHFLKEYLYE